VEVVECNPSIGESPILLFVNKRSSLGSCWDTSSLICLEIVECSRLSSFILVSDGFWAWFFLDLMTRCLFRIFVISDSASHSSSCFRRSRARHMISSFADDSYLYFPCIMCRTLSGADMILLTMLIMGSLFRENFLMSNVIFCVS